MAIEVFQDIFPAQIDLGASLSSAVDLHGQAVLRIDMPATWTAANLTFQVSNDNIAFQNLFDDFGVEVSAQAAASIAIRLQPSDWASVKYLKVRSGTSGTPVVQIAARTINLVCRPI
jgi:hypothetical protein